MSNKIVPAVVDDIPKSVGGGCRAQQTLRRLEDVPQFHKWSFHRPGHAQLQFNLIGENHHLTNFFTPDKGHKYVKLLNPTEISVQRVVEKIKGPSVLCLRGCSWESLASIYSRWAVFKTLTALDISDIAHLTTLPMEISEMTQLESLNLSHLPIQQFPADELLSKLTELCSLSITSCSNLISLPSVPKLPRLESLDLSHLFIESLPESFFSNVTQLLCLILKGCSKLGSLPSIEPLQSLEVLDLSHCITLKHLQLNQANLKKLDLSYTALHCKRDTGRLSLSLEHVFCRDAKGSIIDSLVKDECVKVLDLSGAHHLSPTFELENKELIRALDLSRTSIESIKFLDTPHIITILLLRECSRLVRLPAMKSLIFLSVIDVLGCENLCDLPEDVCELVNLEELNLCGCTSLRDLRENIFDKMKNLQRLNLSNTNFNHLPSSSVNLVTNQNTHIILSRDLVEKVPDLSNLEDNYINLKIVADGFTPPGSDPEIEVENFQQGVRRWDGATLVQGSNNNSDNKPNEIHMVSTFTSTDSDTNSYMCNDSS